MHGSLDLAAFGDCGEQQANGGVRMLTPALRPAILKINHTCGQTTFHGSREVGLELAADPSNAEPSSPRLGVPTSWDRNRHPKIIVARHCEAAVRKGTTKRLSSYKGQVMMRCSGRCAMQEVATSRLRKCLICCLLEILWQPAATTCSLEDTTIGSHSELFRR